MFNNTKNPCIDLYIIQVHLKLYYVQYLMHPGHFVECFSYLRISQKLKLEEQKSDLANEQRRADDVKTSCIHSRKKEANQRRVLLGYIYLKMRTQSPAI